MFNVDFSSDFIGKKELGQFMTPKTISEKLFKLLPELYGNILEPSVGTGEILNLILKYKSIASIDCCEIDSSLSKHIKNTFNVDCINDDFLLYNFNKRYDFIIGNPPFFEFKPTKRIKKAYNDVFNGRVNIYGLFIKKAIDLLNDNGYVAFILPTSINTSIYFEKIRRYIISNTEIISLYDFQNSSLFKNALQNVQIMVLQKKSNTGINYIRIKDRIFFTNKYKEAEELFKNFICIKDLGLSVKTGSIEWNKNKHILSNNNDDTPLIYCKNIQDNTIQLNYIDKRKKQFINKNPVHKNAIVVNRIVGNDKKIKYAFVDFGFCAENHVNVIFGDMQQLQNVLLSFEDQRTQKAISFITNNTQLSKNELENYLPIFI